MVGDSFISYIRIEDLNSIQRRILKKVERRLRKMDVVLDNKSITGIIEEERYFDDILEVLKELEKQEFICNDVKVEVHSRQVYKALLDITKKMKLVKSYAIKFEANINTKYKTIAKKVKLVATQLLHDIKDHIKQAEKEPGLRESKKIGHKFIEETIAKLQIGGGEFLKELEKKRF